MLKLNRLALAAVLLLASSGFSAAPMPNLQESFDGLGNEPSAERLVFNLDLPDWHINESDGELGAIDVLSRLLWEDYLTGVTER